MLKQISPAREGVAIGYVMGGIYGALAAQVFSLVGVLIGVIVGALAVVWLSQPKSRDAGTPTPAGPRSEDR